ncbi:phosphate ABC transporter substrate-binding protein (PhoT family) [Paenibacillus cellulosilyticus]|uniref:Phosphate-binding protein n=1 Tax=Paenibacillus cellulosilyticus TaxID=375489 RepID=A0A2V2YU51_9BACL|nr:phosphate ABC transporter substrate-binding protein [Paenibacillus cellulosilyticus]PWV99383.1 phosphate ABC transporter substrate-binding protein (PhoT family) [Paenibacillus cellulosilyticus]QKS45145.1 phosphate ABC transporter substrate-binding protein [Paenibacillus cellulosilyticus]
MKKFLTIAMALTLTVSLAACGNKDKDSSSTSDSQGSSTTTQSADLSGSILAVGSTALQPLVEQVSKDFMDKNSGVSIQVQGGGSGTGLTQASEGQAQIGNSDVFAEEKLDADKAATLVDHQVAVVAMAAVTNKEVGVDGLTKQQLVDIFTGKVTNWNEVGGKDQKIQIVNRPSSSGTRSTFEKFALGTKTEDLAGSIQEDASGTVKKLVSETPGAIGYLALSYLDDSVQALKYDGVEATVDNVTNGSYPVWAYEHMYTKGEPDAATKAFLDYIASEEVQNGDVVELGYIPASKMEVKRDAAGNVTK